MRKLFCSFSTAVLLSAGSIGCVAATEQKDDMQHMEQNLELSIALSDRAVEITMQNNSGSRIHYKDTVGFAANVTNASTQIVVREADNESMRPIESSELYAWWNPLMLISDVSYRAEYKNDFIEPYQTKKSNFPLESLALGRADYSKLLRQSDNEMSIFVKVRCEIEYGVSGENSASAETPWVLIASDVAP